jgi:hypothetical protein
MAHAEESKPCTPLQSQDRNKEVSPVSFMYTVAVVRILGYINGYPDRRAMGFIQPRRIRVKPLKPDLALAFTWWSAAFPSSKQEIEGNSTVNLEKFHDGWKIVASQTSAAGM